MHWSDCAVHWSDFAVHWSDFAVHWSDCAVHSAGRTVPRGWPAAATAGTHCVIKVGWGLLKSSLGAEFELMADFGSTR